MRRTVWDLLDALGELAAVGWEVAWRAWLGFLAAVSEALDAVELALVVAGAPRGTAVFLAYLVPALLVAACRRSSWRRPWLGSS